MNITFEPANPAVTDAGTLLRVGDECLLVDPGPGTDVESLLAPSDRLVGICLTHLHEDHIAGLPDAVTAADVPIYTSPPTAKMLTEFCDHAMSHSQATFTGGYGFWSLSKTAAHQIKTVLTPVEAKCQPTSGISVRFVPAGHIPGGAGVMVTVVDGVNVRRLFFSGDFSIHAVGQTPGLDASVVASAVDIDTLFLNSTVRHDDTYAETLTTAFARVLEAAAAGQKVLVAASSLTGIHLGYWLRRLTQDRQKESQVTIAGLTARLYQQLGYDTKSVEMVPEYDPEEICSNGQVVITAPGDFESGGAAKVRSAIAGDPNTAIIQIPSGGERNEKGTIADHIYRYAPHPTQVEVDSLVQALNPAQVVVCHGPTEPYKDRYEFALTWRDTGQQGTQHTLVKSGRLVPPEWVSRSTADQILGRNHQRQAKMPTPRGDDELQWDGDATLEPGDARIDRERLSAQGRRSTGSES